MKTSNKWSKVPNSLTILLLQVFVGYQTLRYCSYQLKSRILDQLQAIGNDPKDPRQPLAAWELSICYFSGFGVPESHLIASRWLQLSASRRLPVAEMYCSAIHDAMNMDSSQSLLEGHGSAEQPSQSRKSLDSKPDAGSSTPGQILEPDDPLASSMEVEELDKNDLENGADENDDYSSSDEDLFRTAGKNSMSKLTPEMVDAVTAQKLGSLETFVSETPEILTYQDDNGDTLLLLAARQCWHDGMDFLANQPSLDASICNYNGESALHLVSGFREEQIPGLVSRLVEKKASLHQEGRPRYTENSLHAFNDIHCDPIMRAVLNDDLALLRCLLDVAHKKSTSTCRICENGSKFRKLVALTLSTFRYQALKLIMTHFKTHDKEETFNLDKVRVWSENQLLSLWKVPFRSPVFRVVDYPECFVRAMMHGRDYDSVLRSTISFLLEDGSDSEQRLYEMLKEAVSMDSPHAVIAILRAAKLRNCKPEWWMVRSKDDVDNSPLILAIKYGLRAVFLQLFEGLQNIFQEFLEYMDFSSAVAGTVYSNRRHVNLVQVCLSLAVTASHQDSFFL